MHGHSFLSFGDSGGRFAQTCIGPTQSGMQLRLFKRIPRYFLELALKILRRFLVGGARRGDIARALLSQTEKKSFVVPWIKQFAVGGHRIREYFYGRGVTALEQSLHTTLER